jgi:DNA-binding SARP family transcriptional activator
MELRILGPLEPSDEGRALPAGGEKQRTVLELLLLCRNEVVSAGQLVDALWVTTRRRRR